jgi:hypothetical protein
MLLHFLMMGDAGVASPSLGAVSVSDSTNGAACAGGGCTTKSGSNDSINVSWSIGGADDFYFETKVYRDSSGGGFVLQGTQVSSDVTFTQAAPGALGWAAGPVSVSYTYRVDVINKETGEVVATATSSVFAETYNTTCPGPC